MESHFNLDLAKKGGRGDAEMGGRGDAETPKISIRFVSPFSRHPFTFSPLLPFSPSVLPVSAPAVKTMKGWTNTVAAIYQEIEINRSREFVWDAIRDVGNIHKRLVPGFVVDCQFDGEWRNLTFGNGLVLRELIVSVDDEIFRHSWSARTEQLQHHNASVQVFPQGENGCRVVWIADLKPDEAAQQMAEMIQQGLRTMKQTLEGTSS